MGKRQGIQYNVDNLFVKELQTKVYNASCIRCSWNRDMLTVGLQFNSKASFSANQDGMGVKVCLKVKPVKAEPAKVEPLK